MDPIKIPRLDAHRAVHGIEDLLGARHPGKVDEFLRPLLNSGAGNTPAYARLKAMLEYQSHLGKTPEDFIREMRKRSESVLQAHSHELSVARDYLRILGIGSNLQRFRREVLTPAERRSISLSEAWRRVNSIIDAPYGQPNTNSDRSKDGNSQNPHGHSNGSQGQQHGSHGSNSPGHPNPPPGSSGGGTEPSGQNGLWSLLNGFVAPVGHQSHSSTLSGIGGTVGIGGTGGASALGGGSVCAELLGFRYRSPAFYTGLEFSFGLQAGVNADAIIEVGFCPPERFGGWYFGIGVGGACGVGFVAQVAWSLPEPTLANHPNVPQGFTLGVGIGEDIEIAVVVGGGQVHFWPQ